MSSYNCFFCYQQLESLRLSAVRTSSYNCHFTSCMHMNTCTRTRVRLWWSTCAWLRALARTRWRGARVYVHVHICMYMARARWRGVRVHGAHVHVCTYMYMARTRWRGARVHVHTCTCAHVHMCMYMCKARTRWRGAPAALR